jgi:Protein of unknown function (DUF2510)
MMAVAGWYPDLAVPGQMRYWDGDAWTEQTAPHAPRASATKDYLGNLSATHPKTSSRRVQLFVAIGLAALACLIVGLIIGVLSLHR